MKLNLKTFVLMTAMIILLSIQAFPQWTSNFNPKDEKGMGGQTLVFTGTLDTAAQTYDDLTSNTFSIEDFDANAYISGFYYFNAPVGAPLIYVNWMGSEDNTNFTLVEQIVDTTASETRTYFSTTLGYKRPKYNRLVIENASTGRDNAAFNVTLRLPSRDYGR
jgi:hypothetical protein